MRITQTWYFFPKPGYFGSILKKGQGRPPPLLAPASPLLVPHLFKEIILLHSSLIVVSGGLAIDQRQITFIAFKKKETRRHPENFQDDVVWLLKMISPTYITPACYKCTFYVLKWRFRRHWSTIDRILKEYNRIAENLGSKTNFLRCFDSFSDDDKYYYMMSIFCTEPRPKGRWEDGNAILRPAFFEIVLCQGWFPGNLLLCHSPIHPKLFWPQNSYNLVGVSVV